MSLFVSWALSSSKREKKGIAAGVSMASQAYLFLGATPRIISVELTDEDYTHVFFHFIRIN